MKRNGNETFFKWRKIWGVSLALLTNKLFFFSHFTLISLAFSTPWNKNIIQIPRTGVKCIKYLNWPFLIPLLHRKQHFSLSPSITPSHVVFIVVQHFLDHETMKTMVMAILSMSLTPRRIFNRNGIGTFAYIFRMYCSFFPGNFLPYTQRPTLSLNGTHNLSAAGHGSDRYLMTRCGWKELKREEIRTL